MLLACPKSDPLGLSKVFYAPNSDGPELPNKDPPGGAGANNDVEGFASPPNIFFSAPS
tara:strand:- start:328 stop:501 length:174 start_codon:yes stop_codon:yes gene_type:complete